MTKKKEMVNNKEAIESLKVQIKNYHIQSLKAQVALEVLEQLEKGVEKPNDSESTD